MDSVVNGEIYIKYKPTASIKEQYEGLLRQDEISSTMKKAIDKVIEDDEKAGLKNYMGCDEFWIALVEDNGINMVSLPHLSSEDNKEVFFTDKEELDNTYISLMDFLVNGEYIGKQFRRTKVTADGYRDYMDHYKTNDCLALYKYGDTVICRISFNYFGTKPVEYEIIDGSYLEDGNYEFCGEYTDEYKDKTKLYREITQQLIELNKQRRKK